MGRWWSPALTAAGESRCGLKVKDRHPVRTAGVFSLGGTAQL